MEHIIDFITNYIDVTHAVFTGIGVLISGIIFLITTIVNVKKTIEKIKSERAKTTKALNAIDILDTIETICTEVEAEFQKVNAKMKQTTGSGAGKEKEEVALSRIVEYCKAHGYEYDPNDIRVQIKQFISRSKGIS